MVYTPPAYPAVIPAYIDIWPYEDDISDVEVDVWDAMTKEIRAIMAELGVDPAGAKADVVTRLDDVDTAVAANTAAQHAKQHAQDAAADHTGTVTENNLMDGDANGLPDDSGITVTDAASAVSLKHTAGADTGLGILTTGVPFPAAIVPDADPNTLDEYEEGNWTPDLQFGGAKVNLTYASRAGRYTRKGREVSCTCNFILTANGDSVGNAAVHGLPFAVTNNQGAYAPCALSPTNIGFADFIQALGLINATNIVLYETTNGGVATPLTNADVADTANLSLQITYITG